MAERAIVIVGGGITGAFTAFLCARSGHPVVLLDSETEPYRGTSCNPGGINPLHGPGLPGTMAEFYLASHRYHASLRPGIESLSQMDYGYRVIDRLFLALSEQDRVDLLGMQERYAAADGFSARWCEAGEVLALEPRVNSEVMGGLLTSGNCVVDSERYCRALIKAAGKLGCRYAAGRVTGLSAAGKTVSQVRTTTGTVDCASVVLAAGYRTGELAAMLDRALPVKPLKGELLLLRTADRPYPCDITRGTSGLYRLTDELYWLGGTAEDPAASPGPSGRGRERILQQCVGLLPGLRDSEIVDHRAGYRPVTPDQLPVAGRLPGFDNVYVGTGGGSKGILVSSGIAEVLRRLIVEGADNPCEFLGPERFHA